MTSYSPTQFGYFLTYEMWQDALRLLNYQVARKQKNKHFYTLSMFYYEKLGKRKSSGKTELESIKEERYFKEKIANSLFYGLSNEFGVHPYVQPRED